MSYYRNYYSTGSVAYKVNDIEKEQFNNPKVEKSQIKRPKKVAVYKLKLMCMLLVCFVSGVLFIMQYSQISYKHKEIKDLQKELKESQDKVLTAKGEAKENVDMKYIEEKATKDLGMVKPASYQTVYIDVPKESYTIQY